MSFNKTTATEIDGCTRSGTLQNRANHGTFSAHSAAAIVLLALLGLLLAGCADGKNGKKQSLFAPAANSQPIDPGALQRDLMSFADRYTGAMSDAYDRLADSTTSNEARDVALDRKKNYATAAFTNAIDSSPIVGLMDMLVFSRLTRQSTEDRWFLEMFGDEAPKVTATLKAQEDAIWEISLRYLTPSHQTELGELIANWRREHPDQRYLSRVRMADFSEAKASPDARNKGPGSVFGLLFLDPLSGLDPAVREVERSREAAERMFYYFERMPVLLSWEAEATYREMIAAPQVQEWLNNTAKFTDSTLRFADATRAVAGSIKQFPEFLTQERERTVEQLADKVAEQRDAAVKQLAQAVSAERDAAVKQVADALAAERTATIVQATTQVSGERYLTIEQVQSSIKSEREELLRDVEGTTTRLFDRLFWLELGIVVAAIVLTTMAALAYRALRPGKSAATSRLPH